jgi:hypothetical protein
MVPSRTTGPPQLRRKTVHPTLAKAKPAKRITSKASRGLGGGSTGQTGRVIDVWAPVNIHPVNRHWNWAGIRQRNQARGTARCLEKPLRPRSEDTPQWAAAPRQRFASRMGIASTAPSVEGPFSKHHFSYTSVAIYLRTKGLRRASSRPAKREGLPPELLHPCVALAGRTARTRSATRAARAEGARTLSAGAPKLILSGCLPEPVEALFVLGLGIDKPGASVGVG